MEPLLQVENLKTYFNTVRGVVKAVDGISFSVRKEEFFGLVGESGCGKSTTALSIMRMLDDTARIDGRMIFKGKNIAELTRRQLRQLWGKSLFMIFQDPMTCLNPVMRIMGQLGEVFRMREGRWLSKKEATRKGVDLLRQVDILDPERVLEHFPHQLSGGMKQRVMIAFGIALNPDLLLLDEPTTALDSTVQFKVVELLLNLKVKYKMSQILITHDFGVAAKLCDRIAVMYAGKIVEQGRYVTLLNQPKHPYTEGLFECIIKPGIKKDYLETMKGYLPSLYDLPKGCYFEPRCEMRKETCSQKEPVLVDLGDEHLVACHLYHGAK
jgi:peptide/nickel transport system ATP-binding protein